MVRQFDVRLDYQCNPKSEFDASIRYREVVTANDQTSIFE